MVPGTPRHIVITMEVAVSQDVQPGPILVAQHHRQGILEFLAESPVHHAGIKRLAPHAHIKPARPGPGAGDSTRKNSIRCYGEHGPIDSPGLPFQQEADGKLDHFH